MLNDFIQWNDDFKLNKSKINLCKRLAHEESSQQIIRRFKKPTLTKNCRQLHIKESSANTNCRSITKDNAL